MSKRIALLAFVTLAAAGLVVSAATARAPMKSGATASTHMLVGINDEANTLYGDPQQAFTTLQTLKAQVLRVNLYWGGSQYAVGAKKPRDATDPGDPNYNWGIYDRLVRYATQYNVQVVFSILFTPSWALFRADCCCRIVTGRWMFCASSMSRAVVTMADAALTCR